MQPLKIRSKRPRVAHGSALVFDFETNGAEGIAPPDQPPIQVAYSVLRLGDDELPEVLHEALLISDRTDEIGPFHQGYRTFMRSLGVELDPDEDDPEKLLQACRRIIKTTGEYKKRNTKGRTALSKMLGKLAGATDRFTIKELRQYGIPLREAGLKIMRAVEEHDVRYLVAHNARHMDIPHMRAAVECTGNEAMLAAFDRLAIVDTMEDVHFRTSFLPPPPPKERASFPVYPGDFRVLEACTDTDGRIMLRVSVSDPNHTIEAVVRQFALRIDVDGENERGGALARLFAYDFDNQPAVFAASIRDDDTIWLFHDPAKSRPLIGPPNTSVTFAQATAHPIGRGTLKYPSQDELLARYRLLNDAAHDGSADVRALCKLLRRGPWCPRTLTCGFRDIVGAVIPPMQRGDRMQFEDMYTGSVVDGRFCGIVARGATSWGVRVRIEATGSVHEYDRKRITRLLV